MLLFDIGTYLFLLGLSPILTIIIFKPKNFLKMDDTARFGCFCLMIILSIIGGIVMIIAHYFVAGIPIKLW